MRASTLDTRKREFSVFGDKLNLHLGGRFAETSCINALRKSGLGAFRGCQVMWVLHSKKTKIPSIKKYPFGDQTLWPQPWCLLLSLVLTGRRELTSSRNF